MTGKRYEFISEVPDNLRQKLSKYFTNVGGRTFAITGLPPELTGAALARYSRAPTGMQLTIVNEFLDEHGEPSQKHGSQLMERVLNGFGDDSVGELEGTHSGIEDISQLATKSIEDRRIGASPIEQSTRYVRYDRKDETGRWRYLRPREIMESGFGKRFEAVTDKAFEVYSEGVRKLTEFFREEFPRGDFRLIVERGGKSVQAGEKELLDDNEARAFITGYNFTVRCAALDVGRCVLPSSTLTHLGLLGNGRYYTNLLTHLKSSELSEERERGFELETELNKVIPTFIKRNRVNPEVAQKNAQMRSLADELFRGIKPTADRVTIVPRGDYLDEVLASSLFPYANLSLPQIMEEIAKMPIDKKLGIMDSYIGKRQSRRDRSGRGLEAGYPLLFDLVGNFAEYRDLERHRMLTQQRQLFTPDLGFILPSEMREVGLEGEVLEVNDMMADLNSDLRKSGLVLPLQYATLFNNRIRFMFGMNLREFQHLSELRTMPSGHFGYRSMVQEMAQLVGQTYPWAVRAFEYVDYSDPGNKIARAKEQSRIAGRNLADGISADIDLE